MPLDLNAISLPKLRNRTKELLNTYQRLSVQTIRNKLELEYSKDVLTKISVIFGKERNAIPSEIQLFLKENWQNINGTCLCYTTLPESDITLLLCQSAIYAAKNLHQKSTRNVLNLLMPTVQTVSYSDDFPDLNIGTDNGSLEHLQFILKTHCLAQNGSYLIPLRLLPNILENNKYNPYFNYQVHSEQCAVICEEEISRLIAHSTSSRELRDAFLNYQASQHNQDNLFGRLNILCRAMYINSKVALGNSENAGSGIYAMILSFRDYWQGLKDSQLKLIPEAVKRQINLLLTLSFNPNANKNATETIETCLATRRYELQKAMSDCEKELCEIGMQEQEKVQFILQAKQNYFQARECFLKTITNKSYAGNDPLKLTKTLIDCFKVNISILSLRDLHDLFFLNAQEIREIGKNPSIGKQIANQWANTGQFILFFVDAKLEQLEAILSISAPHWFQKFLHGLPHVFQVLTDDQLAVLVRVLAPLWIPSGGLTHVIKTLFKDLESKKQELFISSLKPYIPSFIKNFEDFINLIHYLNPIYRKTVFSLLEKTFPSIIENKNHVKNNHHFKNNFIEALLYFENTEKQLLCDVMSAQFPMMIYNVDDLRWIAPYIPSVKQCSFLMSVQFLLPNIINCSNDLKTALTPFLPAQCQIVLDTVKDKLSKLIKTSSDLVIVLKRLDATQQPIFLNAVQQYIPTLITDPSTLINLLDTLKVEYAVDQKVIDNLFTNSDDVVNILRACSPAHFALLLKALKDILPHLIKKRHDLLKITNGLDDERSLELCQVIAEDIPGIIKNGEGLLELLPQLSPVQTEMICNLIHVNFPSLLKNVQGLQALLSTMTNEQCEIMSRTLVLYTSNFIEKSDNLVFLLSSLNASQCFAIHKMIHEYFVLSKGDFSELDSLLRALCPAKCLAVYHAIKPILNTLIIKPEYLNKLVNYLPNEEGITLIKGAGNFLLHHIARIDDLLIMVDSLTPEVCAAVLSVLKNRLRLMINHIDNYVLVCGRMSAKQKVVFCEALKDHLPTIIKSTNDFMSGIRYLTMKGREQIYSAIKARIGELIHTASDFCNIIHYLSLKFNIEFYNEFKPLLPQLVTSKQDFLCVFSELTEVHRKEFALTMVVKLESLFQDVPSELPSFLNRFLEHQEKKLIEHCYFRSLLMAIQSHNNVNDLTYTKIYTDLETAVLNHFDKKILDRASFQNKCDAVIDSAYHVLQKQEKLCHLLNKWKMSLQVKIDTQSNTWGFFQPNKAPPQQSEHFNQISLD